MTRSRLCTLFVAVVALAITASPTLAEPECVRVRGTAQGVQSGDAFSPWHGPVEIRFRGKVYEGTMTWLATDAGLPSTPPFHLVTHGKATLDLGPAGSFAVWGLLESAPADGTFTNWKLTGFQCLGTPMTDPFIWGGTGMFAVATGWLEIQGAMHWQVAPPPGDPNTMEIRLSGRICGIDWD